MLGPNVYFRDLWNQCINSKAHMTGTISKLSTSEVGARCARFVLKKCGGHPGSAELWSLLRENSEAKLAVMETQMSNAYKEQDVQKLHRAQFQKCPGLARRSLGLMDRASTINKDRASVIIANNPLPDLNDLDGKDSPMRFLTKNPSKVRYPLRKQLNLPPLKDAKQQSSNIPKQEGQGMCQKKVLATTKKESSSYLTRRKNWRKIPKPTYLQSPKLAAKPSLKPWSFEQPGRETSFQTLLWEPLIGSDFKKCKYIASGTSKECKLADTMVISISDGLDACHGSFAYSL
ncbi:uncharacterized protein [Narcine bancroftii]|uniref:uncharacterized protein isoform X2 n=1 Tax=Narcine bancroftii TaxID=1343680 RepID=UPI0038322528